MTIEVKEKGTKEFYEEVVNVISQYGRLLRYPDMRLKNNFKSLRNVILLMVGLFVVNLACGLIAEFDPINIVAMVMVAVAGVIAFVYRNNMRKMVDRYLADDRQSVVTLDEKGVEIKKEGAEVVRLAWEGVAFARKFSESVCFLSKDVSGLVIAVNNAHQAEILKYLDEHEIPVKVVKYA